MLIIEQNTNYQVVKRDIKNNSTKYLTLTSTLY